MGSWPLPDLDDEWRWADYTTEDGLPPVAVVSMAEDGELTWLATRAGVVFFDGYAWRPAPGLDPSVEVLDLHAVPGSPAAVGGASGLFVGDSTGFERVPVPGIPPRSTRIYDVAWASPSELLFVAGEPSTGRPILYSRRNGVVSRLRPPGVLLDRRPFLHHTAGGHVILPTRIGLHRFEPPGRWIRLLSPTDTLAWVPALEANREGRVVGSVAARTRAVVAGTTRDGLARVPSEGEHIVTAAAVTPDGLRLALHDSGHLRVEVDGRWQELEVPSGRRESMNHVFAAGNGDLWIASVRGLHLFRRLDPRWTRVREPFPSRHNRINAILPSPPDSTLWLGTGGGIRKVADRHPDYPLLEEIEEIDGADLGAVTGLARDSTGGVWAVSGGSFQGALRLAPDGTVRRIGPEQGLGFVHDVAVDAEGIVHFLALEGGRGSGVYRLEGDSVRRLADPDGLLRTRAYAFLQTRDGARWYGTRGGLVRERNGTWTSWQRGDVGPGVSRVWDLGEMEDGRILVTTGEYVGPGLVVFDPRTGEGTPLADEDRRLLAVQSITRDERGRLWIADEQGLAVRTDDAWARIDGRHGLVGAWVWPVAVSPKRVFVGTSDGLSVLSRSEESPPAARIAARVETADRNELQGTWRVHTYRGRIRPEIVQTRFALDDGPWSPWSTAESIRIPALPSGDHRLHLESRGLFGATSGSVTVPVQVPPPLLLRPVFTFPLAAGFISLLVLGLSARARRQERDAAIRASEGRLRALLEQAPEAILLFEPQAGVFVDANEQAHRLLGWPVAEFRRMSPAALCPEEQPDGRASDATLADLVARTVESGETLEAEWIFRGKDGRELPTLLRMARLPEPEAHLVRLSILDRTEQKAAEAARRQLQTQLVQAQKLEAVGQLTGGVAHDFNNLLTVIMGNLDFIALRADSEDVRRYADEALRAAESGSELVRGLLAFSARQSLAPMDVDVGTVIRDFLPLLRRSLGRDILIEVEVPAGLPTIRVDRTQLESALMNLSVNARDALAPGGRITVRAEDVTLEPPAADVAEVAPGPYLCITVADNGAGMPPGIVDHVFEPFFTTKPVGKGSGLGLSMVYGFTRQSGGFARIESDAGEGTRVYLYFPVERDGGGPAEIQETAGARPSG